MRLAEILLPNARSAYVLRLAEGAGIAPDDQDAPSWRQWQLNAATGTYDLPKTGLPRVGLTKAEHRALQKARTSRKAAAALPLETVATTSVMPTQHYVHASAADALRDAGAAARDAAREPVILFRKDGRTYVSDGHHGLVAALMRGDPTFSGRLIDFDNYPQS